MCTVFFSFFALSQSTCHYFFLDGMEVAKRVKIVTSHIRKLTTDMFIMDIVGDIYYSATKTSYLYHMLSNLP